MSTLRLKTGRCLLRLALLSPFLLAGCGNPQDDTQVKIGDASKAEAKARAELYKERALEKKTSASKR